MSYPWRHSRERGNPAHNFLEIAILSYTLQPGSGAGLDMFAVESNKDLGPEIWERTPAPESLHVGAYTRELTFGSLQHSGAYMWVPTFGSLHEGVYTRDLTLARLHPGDYTWGA